MESMDGQMRRLFNIIKANNAKYTSNNEVIQAYIELTGKLSKEAIDVEKRLVRNEANVFKFDQETREKLLIIQKLIHDKPIMGCTYCENVFNDKKQLKGHYTDNSFLCEHCNVCYQRTLPDTFIHSTHKYISKLE